MILILAYSVESLQYFDILSPLGLENSALARLVLGAVYDPLDIFAYTLGGILIYFFDRFFTSRYIQN